MRLILLFAFLIIFQSSFSQDNKWDIEKYKGTTKKFSIKTDEGTWMNLDVSSDGKDIVFDMLGDIYLMPITGGEAKPLSEGIACLQWYSL